MTSHVIASNRFGDLIRLHLGHSLGGLQKWSPAPDNAVLKAMTDTRFEVMGVSRSYLDLFWGLAGRSACSCSCRRCCCGNWRLSREPASRRSVR